MSVSEGGSQSIISWRPNNDASFPVTSSLTIPPATPNSVALTPIVHLYPTPKSPSGLVPLVGTVSAAVPTLSHQVAPSQLISSAVSCPYPSSPPLVCPHLITPNTPLCFLSAKAARHSARSEPHSLSVPHAPRSSTTLSYNVSYLPSAPPLSSAPPYDEDGHAFPPCMLGGIQGLNLDGKCPLLTAPINRSPSMGPWAVGVVPATASGAVFPASLVGMAGKNYGSSW